MKQKIVRLPNGLTCLFVASAESTSVTVNVSVRAGSFYETNESRGISHFLEHMCFKGTTKRPRLGQISEELDMLGAQSNAHTSTDHTAYYVRALPKHLETVIDIVSDIYLHSTFPVEEIEKEKGVVCDEIAMYEDDPQSQANDLLLKTVFDPSWTGWNVIGTKENVRAITQDALRAYKQKHYIAEKTIITVAGNFDIPNTLALIKKYFKAIPQRKIHTFTRSHPKLQTVHMAQIDKSTEQTHLRLAFKGIHRLHKDKYATLLLAGILGSGMSSRLFTELRTKRGMSYYVGAYAEMHAHYGLFHLYTGVPKERVAEAEAIMIALCVDLKKEMVPDAELQKIKDMYIAQSTMGLETSRAYASFVLSFLLDEEEVQTIAQVQKKIRAVKKEDILRVAKTLFDTKKLYSAKVG